MRPLSSTNLLLLLSLSQRVVSWPSRAGGQVVFAPPANSGHHDNPAHSFDGSNEAAVRAALDIHTDPVAALLYLQPELAAQLAEQRLIHVLGQAEPEWMTEGDKLRLRQEKLKFMDITDHQDLYKDPVNAWAGNASKLFPLLGWV